MPSKKQLLSEAKLYLILDKGVNSYDELFDIVKKALPAGIDIIQLRDKNGSPDEILRFSKAVRKLMHGKALYIINDRADLALQGQADGVHLGQEDGLVADARTVLGEEALIGVSCQTLEHALKAQNDGADYIGFGSVFKTLTKPERGPMDLQLLDQATKAVKLPLFAIGGIDLNNIGKLKHAGVGRIAVCRAICQADNVEQAVKQFKESISEANVRDNALRA